MTALELKIASARLPRPSDSGLYDIAIASGQIVAIAPHINQPAATLLDAEGKLVIPALVDPHFHLDKALLFERQPAIVGGFQEAMQKTRQAKAHFTVEDIQQRARRILEAAIAWGVTAMRSHVEVDPAIGLNSLEALRELRAEYAWGLTLQLAIFAQEGITNEPETLPLLRRALAAGGDLIGSAPYVDPDPEQNVRRVFDLAAEFDCDVDFHLDFLDDDEPLLLPFVVAETERRGWQGRVCLGHVTKLASLPPAALMAIAHPLAAAGISVLALPASDVYMMARRDTHNVRRGVAPLHQLAECGVNVATATNNVQNLFTPFGDSDPLKIATLLAQLLHWGTLAQFDLALAAVTGQAARAIGLGDRQLAPGHAADLVILPVQSVSEAIAAPPSERTVIRAGRVVAQRQMSQRLGLAPRAAR